MVSLTRKNKINKSIEEFYKKISYKNKRYEINEIDNRSIVNFLSKELLLQEDFNRIKNIVEKNRYESLLTPYWKAVIGEFFDIEENNNLYYSLPFFDITQNKINVISLSLIINKLLETIYKNSEEKLYLREFELHYSPKKVKITPILKIHYPKKLDRKEYVIKFEFNKEEKDRKENFISYISSNFEDVYVFSLIRCFLELKKEEIIEALNKGIVMIIEGETLKERIDRISYIVDSFKETSKGNFILKLLNYDLSIKLYEIYGKIEEIKNNLPNNLHSKIENIVDNLRYNILLRYSISKELIVNKELKIEEEDGKLKSYYQLNFPYAQKIERFLKNDRRNF